MSDPWTDTSAAITQHRNGRNVRIAMTIYEAALADGGRFTVDELARDWKLDPGQRAELLAHVRRAWGEGRWPERRCGRRTRRIGDPSPSR